MKNLDPRNLERLSATPEKRVAPVSGKTGKATPGAVDHIMKPSNEQLVVFVCTNSSFSTNAGKTWSPKIEADSKKEEANNDN